MSRMIPTLETERLVLRAPTADDFPVYRDFYADAEASAFYGGPLRPDRAWRALAADIGHWVLRGFGRWSVTVRASGEMVGGCGLWWPEAWPRSELTWWITSSARRKGYASEASRAAIRYGYDDLRWPIVETHMHDDNLGARKLVDALGGEKIARETFPDGIERDVFRLPRG